MIQKQFKRMLSPKECMPNTSASGPHSGLETFACALRFMVGPFLRKVVSFFFNSTRQVDIINSVITSAFYFVAAKYSIYVSIVLFLCCNCEKKNRNMPVIKLNRCYFVFRWPGICNKRIET